jgi:hypothetical protein
MQLLKLSFFQVPRAHQGCASLGIQVYSRPAKVCQYALDASGVISESMAADMGTTALEIAKDLYKHLNGRNNHLTKHGADG